MTKWSPYTNFDLSRCLWLGSRDLDYVHNLPHNGEHLWQVTLKFKDKFRSSVPNKHFSITSKCDLNFWVSDLVHACDTASYSGEHFYEFFIKNPTMRWRDMFWTKLPCFIIFSNLDLAYINLNYMFRTSSHDNDHLCFNPSINDGLNTYLIFLLELLLLCMTFTLTTGT
jgi:hypothetical protein